MTIGAPEGGDDGNDDNGGDGGGDQLNDEPQEDGDAPGTGPGEDQGGDDLDDQQEDEDVILVENSPPHKAVKCSSTPLSTSGRNVDMDASMAGNTNDGLAISPSGMVLGDDDGSQLLPNPDMLRLIPSMSAASCASIDQVHSPAD